MYDGHEMRFEFRSDLYLFLRLGSLGSLPPDSQGEPDSINIIVRRQKAGQNQLVAELSTVLGIAIEKMDIQGAHGVDLQGRRDKSTSQ